MFRCSGETDTQTHRHTHTTHTPHTHTLAKNGLAKIGRQNTMAKNGLVNIGLAKVGHDRPMSGVPFTCFPVSWESTIDSSAFRVLILRRLWLPLPPSSSNCRCGFPPSSLRAGWGVGSSGLRSRVSCSTGVPRSRR